MEILLAAKTGADNSSEAVVTHNRIPYLLSHDGLANAEEGDVQIKVDGTFVPFTLLNSPNPQAGSVLTLGDLSAAGAGTAVALADVLTHNGLLLITGTFVGTASIEVSVDGGTTYAVARDNGGAAVSGITTPRSVVIAGNATDIRANVTAYTSGTIAVRLMPPHKMYGGAMKLTSSIRTIALHAPGVYRVAKDTTAAAVGIFGSYQHDP